MEVVVRFPPDLMTNYKSGKISSCRDTAIFNIFSNGTPACFFIFGFVKVLSDCKIKYLEIFVCSVYWKLEGADENVPRQDFLSAGSTKKLLGEESDDATRVKF